MIIRSRTAGLAGVATIATLIAMLSATLAEAPARADDHRTPAPEGARVYFIAPQNGATVSSPVTVRFGLSGMGVAPAGVEKGGTGHHHLLIDQELEDYDTAIPADDAHRHFGGGQTETTVDLAPGTHTLQLVVGDHNHIPHMPPVESARITITVE
ncbi:DUF4399 domain-containing protein [Stappia sp.]|uniref:DUF4399 domain-containing protein n=1 Tax=Stappia sp. TaxID=1870903 RepID=UPI0035B558CC